MNRPDSGCTLDSALARARWARRRRRMLEAGLLSLVLVVLSAGAAVAAMDAWLFDPDVVERMRHGFILGAAVALIPLIIAAVAPLPDHELALYLETEAPQLDALMLSAVEARTLLGRGDATGDTSPALAGRLVDRAAQAYASSPELHGLESRRSRRALTGLAAVSVTVVALVALGPDGWRHGASLLFRPAADPVAGSPYAFDVLPGHATVLAGADLRVSATPLGFDPEQITVLHRPAGGGEWTSTTLPRSGDAGTFETFFFNLEASMEYRVSHEVVHSPVYRIDVATPPVAQRIDLLYQFPAHTGRAPELVRDGGDIEAVRGTRVEVRVTPSGSARGGRLVLDGERHVNLQTDHSGGLHATIEVRDNGRYRVELEADDYGMVAASTEHAIVALADTRPRITFVGPGRDVRVTSIEEIGIDVRAEDDVAVRELELVLSVNGGADEVISLADSSDPKPVVDGRLELRLEEHGLSPGDLIAYHVRARDAPADPARQVSSDIYFMDVRPFEMSYRPSGGAGGGGGGRAGAQQEETLSAQQRTLVVAMFKLLRDRGSMDQEAFAERTEILSAAQSRIRDRTEAIVRRLEARTIVDLNPGYRRMAEELPEAAKSMHTVEAFLGASDLGNALPAARLALLHLQRAESAFREVQVAQARQRAGGGSAASDLSNLFRLEMDRFRNQYEDVRRGDWRRRDPQIDETMRRLRELAERQQRELERARARARSGTGADSQRALAEEVERLMRELERLTRHRSSEELRASLRALENAARAMRRSADQGDARAGAEALDRLREARRLLDAEGPARLARDTGEAMKRAEELIRDQGRIERDVARAQGNGQRDPADAAELAERKRALAEDVKEMESTLDRLSERARRERQSGASTTLKGAADGLREDGIEERIRRSAEEIARRRAAGEPGEESDIADALRRLRARIAAAGRQIGEADDTRLSRMLDQLRGTMRGLERDRERLADRERRGPALPGRGSRADVEPADLADLRQSLEQRAGGIGGLAEALAGEPGLGGDLAALLSALQGARLDEDADADILARRQAELLAALQRVEQSLRARLGQTLEPAFATARTEPPSAHRDAVERYYRNLSETSSP